MALSRKFLKAMGLTEEQIDSVVEAHRETVDGLQKSLTSAEEKANKLGNVEKELNDLKTANAGKPNFEELYNADHTALENLRSEIAAKEARTAKEAAISAFFEKNNIVGNQKKLAMMVIKGDIDGYEVDESGKLKDTAKLDALIKGELAGLVSTTRTEGADIAEPPANIGKTEKTKEEIMEIKDTQKRQKAWAEYLGKD